MKFILNYIRKETWSPYVAGVLLGLVGIAAVWISNSLLGASGAFENLAGMIGKSIAPALFDNMYFNFIMPPGITTSVILIVGIFFGGMLGAATSASVTSTPRTVPPDSRVGTCAPSQRPSRPLLRRLWPLPPRAQRLSWSGLRSPGLPVRCVPTPT